jgi:pyruvate/2-oxoacid:ferredoxin oxidoreductase alpha subunit
MIRLRRNEVWSEMAERVLLKNNEVIAESAIRAGCRCFSVIPSRLKTK